MSRAEANRRLHEVQYRESCIYQSFLVHRFTRSADSSIVPSGNRGEVSLVVQQHVDGFYD